MHGSDRLTPRDMSVMRWIFGGAAAAVIGSTAVIIYFMVR